MKYDFCLHGPILENSLSKENFPFPHILAERMQRKGESLSFSSTGVSFCVISRSSGNFRNTPMGKAAFWQVFNA